MIALSRPILGRLWPHASAAMLDAVAAQSASVFGKYQINTPLRLSHFMAQISHESGGGTITAESLTYTHAARIAAVWPKRFTVDSAAPFVGNARALANKVYNGRMGNAAVGEDGYNFRGRGLLQITGRDSYRTIGGLCGLPLEQQPDMAFAPEHALDVAAAEFVHLGCLPYCDADDVRVVTRRVNGGYIGLDSRKGWLTRWKLAIPELPGQLPEADADLHAVAPVDAEPVARGGDNDISTPPATMAQSTIGNSTIAAGVGTTATTGAAVLKSVSEAPSVPDTSSISDLLDHAGTGLDTVSRISDLAPPPSTLKVVLGFMTDPLVVGALGACTIAFLAYIWLRRRKHLQQDGV